MREYGQIQCAFWTSLDSRAMTDDAKLLAVYVLTGPHSNGLGCYVLPDGYVMADLGWTQQRVSKGFGELFQTGFADRCSTTSTVLIPNFLRWNPITNGNVAKARWKEFESINKNASVFNRLCACILKHGNHLPNSFETLLKPFAERFTEGYGKQDPTLPDPTRSTSAASAADTHPRSNGSAANEQASEYPPEFERTWKTYPSRAGGNPKPRALKAWRARIRDGATPDDIHAGVSRYAAWASAKGKAGTEFVMQAATFFGPDRRWEEPWDSDDDRHNPHGHQAGVPLDPNGEPYR